MKNPKITIIGSINMDLVTKTATIPKVGETILGEAFHTIPGGKGANQAVAAARLGADVTLIGAVGNDAFGSNLKQHLSNQGIDTTHIQTIDNKSTGIASITLANGDNSIIVVPGANDEVTPSYITQLEEVIAKSTILLLQLEIPLETVKEAIKLAKKHNIRVILNPAPIQKLPKDLLDDVDYFTPNEHEQELLLQDLSNYDLIEIKKKSIVTKGSKGVTLYQNNEETDIPSYKVEAVDTTGAGDSFNGALAVSLSKGETLEQACQFANTVAALSVTKLGAQTGMPTMEEVNTFFGDNRD